MNFTSGALPPLLAEALVRKTFEWGRIQSNTDWILPVGALALILVFVRWMYVRDAADWHPALGWLLTVLRTLALVGLLIVYLQPQWRQERELTRNSRVLLLVDTSLSMGLSDADSPSPGASKSRAAQVAAALAESDFLDRLRNTHDVAVLQFGEEMRRDRVVSLAKFPTAAASTPEDSSKEAVDGHTDAVDWNAVLSPTGSETRLGQALRQLIRDERGSPLSAIVLFSDGGQNAGIAPDAAIELAREANVPIYTVGIGSDKLPTNVGVRDLVVPSRAYPGDHYAVTGFIQAQGMAGRVVEVRLLSRAAGDSAEPGTGEVEDRQQVTLAGDGEVIPVKFELAADKPGRRTLCFRIEPPEGDAATDDNFREADVEIVARKNRTLLLAGGPTREYRFLRTQLYRDRSTTVDVLLQSGRPGISQEADKLLDDFPLTRPQMFQYDCVVAFDPDWQALSDEQIDLLETWVAEQGGGLIVIGGQVYTGRSIGGWIEDRRMAKILALYPVEFYRRLSGLDEGMVVTQEPWPLQFTREGLEAEYLRPADTATAARAVWAGFQGVYGYCPLRGPKPGATVLARFSDPRSGQDGELPVFFAEQFYGAGRVFYLGSGEIWRLRRSDDSYFEQFYTKLIRHVSQGRLLRGSSRGVLLVGQDRYLLGNTVEVRAQLTNARLEPLEAPEAEVQVIHPDGHVETVALQGDPRRAGMYAGRFPVLQEGAYRLELPVPESLDEQLTRRIQVRVPELERENPQRNDALLGRIAQRTDGKYYVGVGELFRSTGEPMVAMLKDRTRTIIELDNPDRLWEQTWMRWMMFLLCGLLCGEWLLRRLFRMA